jgi:hypothetical protein
MVLISYWSIQYNLKRGQTTMAVKIMVAGEAFLAG